ncbi:hypothetical protein ARAF_0407 [Arsenophonus endosymbiont of Aleurodicus floccissimus]|nr:hypothetical protein ARAF_0407 [Arsenophonus endosymbiont of Aleurodicus floccissimus]
MRRSQHASPLSWQMHYSQVGRGQDTRLLSAVDYPTGMRDEVIYQDEGLRFPAASGQNNYLPVVLKHHHLPGGEGSARARLSQMVLCALLNKKWSPPDVVIIPIRR